jgi:hypothetical protein
MTPDYTKKTYHLLRNVLIVVLGIPALFFLLACAGAAVELLR